MASIYLILIIYSASVILSIILYSIFVCIFTKNEKEKNENGNKYRVCEICGYTIYSENIVLNLNPPCCECCKLLCNTCLDCINMTTSSLCCCLDKEEKDEFNCCYCCCERNDKIYKKNNEFFCYCYQAKRKQNWFNKFITSEIQKKIFPYMLEYFFLQFLTIAFEKQYYTIPIKEFKPSFNETDYYQSIDSRDTGFKREDWLNCIHFIVTFFLFFYFTLSFNTLFNFNDESEITDDNPYNMINHLSNGILDGTHGILIFDGIYSLILSAIYLADNDANIFQSHYFIFAPILMNKFYYFTLIYFCVSFSESKKKFELISGSTLISVYLNIWNFIISLIRDLSSLNGLYITQIVFASFPCLFASIILITLICGLFYMLICDCNGRRFLANLFCFCSFLVCFGGFWIKGYYVDDIEECVCDCNCCDLDCYCCIDCFDYCSCLDCACYLYRCECCNCCECYDCFDCCDCFYCCGPTCSCYSC